MTIQSAPAIYMNFLYDKLEFVEVMQKSKASLV